MKSPRQRIIDHVAQAGPISIALIACDLGLPIDIVKTIIKRCMQDGRLEYGWDGQEIRLTDQEIVDRRHS